MRNAQKNIYLLLLVFISCSSICSATSFIYPTPSDTLIGNNNFIFIIQANVTDTAVLYNSVVTCILTDGTCKFNMTYLEFVEGFNNLEFEVMDSEYNSYYVNATFYWYENPPIPPIPSKCTPLQSLIFSFIIIALLISLLLWIFITKERGKEVIEKIIFSVVFIIVIWGLTSTIC